MWCTVCWLIPVLLVVVGWIAFQKLNPKFTFPKISSGYVLVTGASTGIGADAAIYLALKGFQVFAGVRKPEAAEALKKNLVSKGGDASNLEGVILDVTNAESIKRAQSTVAQKVGDKGLSALVNNAGVHTDGPVEFQSMDEIRYQFDVNFFGQIAVIQAFMPLLRRAQGRVVNVTSVAGFMAAPFEGAYAASKFALEGATDALRRELLPWKMSVSLIEPGFIKTELVNKVIDHHNDVLKNMPKGATTYYGVRYGDARRIPEKLTGTAELTSKAICHAISSSNPLTRYVVGSPAFLSMIRGIRLVPDRFADQAIAQKTWPRKYKLAPAFVPDA